MKNTKNLFLVMMSILFMCAMGCAFSRDVEAISTLPPQSFVVSGTYFEPLPEDQAPVFQISATDFEPPPESNAPTIILSATEVVLLNAEDIQ